MDDFSELLGRARAGDRDAVDAIYREYRDAVARAARDGLGPFLHQQYDTIDISQSVFGDMIRELPAFEDRGEPAFRRWLLTKVHNKLCVKARRQVLADGLRRERRLETETGLAAAHDGAEPGEVVASRDEEERLGVLLGALDPADREVIGLYVDEALPWAEVARRLGLASPDAARMRFVRAMTTLRRRWTRA
jgi:RNA polymerase sigma factor (sigma-70 family)